jgi:hypothetical protein
MTPVPRNAFPPEELSGVRCSHCGEVVTAAAQRGSGALVELYCTRCGRSDVYHEKCLLPLSRLLKARESGGAE